MRSWMRQAGQRWALGVALAGGALALWAQGALAADIDYTRWTTRTIKPLPGAQVTPGGWSRDGQTIRFGVWHDRTNGGLDTLYATSPDGAGTRCISCGLEGHWRIVGSMAPYGDSSDGRFLLANSFGAVVGAGEQYVGTHPGGSVGNLGQVADIKLYALELGPDGTAAAAHLLAGGDVDEAPQQATFTPDGKQVIWWESRGSADKPPEEWKRWRIMIADFVVGSDGIPRLENTRALVDRGGGFVESGGVTGDGKSYYFMATIADDPELFVVDLATGEQQRLSDHLGWDEFPNPSPNGEVVYFMSDRAWSNPVCDPVWQGQRTLGSHSDLDFAMVAVLLVPCLIGELRAEPSPDQAAGFAIRSNFDGYLMAPDGTAITRLTPNGGATIGSWSPDSSALMMPPATVDAGTDELAIFEFARARHRRGAGKPRSER